VNLSKLLGKTTSTFVSKGIKSGQKIIGINFSGLKGIFGKELMEDYRFGTELASKVKSISGLKGIIHSDEDLKKYKFSDEDISKIKDQLNAKDEDCFVLVLGTEKEVDKAIDVIIKRVKQAFKGVPPETRRALENGNTEFLRELHGGARLYPDTDSQAIINVKDDVKTIKENLPDYPWITIKKYSKKYKIEERLIKELIFTGNLDLFNDIIKIYPDNPNLIVSVLLETTTALRRDGKNVDNISHEDYKEIFNLLGKNEIGKEAIEEIMDLKADSPKLTIQQIKKQLNIESLSLEDLKVIVNKVVDSAIDLVKEKEMRAMGPLMGEVMKEVRGKIDGKIVSDELKKALTIKLEDLK
jgi:glutamyl-tRNA(Gln) amidotransferase subunit E